LAGVVVAAGVTLMVRWLGSVEAISAEMGMLHWRTGLILRRWETGERLRLGGERTGGFRSGEEER
jgi:hypothetical protein